MIETKLPAAEILGETWDQQKIIQVLSHTKYKWHSLKRLAAATGLEKGAMDAALTQLLKKDVVKPAFGKRAIVFGLRDRVDKK